MKNLNRLKDKSDIFVALDFADQSSARRFLNTISPHACHIKIGLEMFTKFGPEWVKALIDDGYDIFLDLKCFDIPNTVAQSMKSIASLGVAMTTVHAMGGLRMMQAAKDAIADFATDQKPLLIAVTILTSYTDEEIQSIFGDSIDLKNLALHLAVLAKQAGMDGVVCSAHEAKAIQALCGKDFCIVTPGIRLEHSHENTHDQRRIATPHEARSQGSSFLVVGRAITQSSHPMDVLQQLRQAESL
jgi:orotidine-5'-phosphate decarboxylase